MTEPARRPLASPEGGLRRPTVLVADDYPENRRLLYFYLRDRYEVLQVATAEEAVAVLRERQAAGAPVAVAVLDLNFCDGMNGIEAVQAIRRDPLIAAVRTLALTAYAYPDDRDRCLEAGFDDYVSKPVFKAGLLEKLDGLLGAQPLGDGASGEPGAVWISRPDKGV
ncbi:MAG TPA: response regulator [Rubricoccaceae bacterium]|nr:response regulator [Rubricoccaceae bacterium]